MTVKILAKDDTTLKNGSYFHVRTYRKSPSVVSVYMLGDFQGYRQVIPDGLKEYSVAEAKLVRSTK